VFSKCTGKKHLPHACSVLRLNWLYCLRIQTAEQAELQYKKREKKEAAFGWEVFNQKSLYNAYMKRAEKVGTPQGALSIYALQWPCSGMIEDPAPCGRCEPLQCIHEASGKGVCAVCHACMKASIHAAWAVAALRTSCRHTMPQVPYSKENHEAAPDPMPLMLMTPTCIISPHHPLLPTYSGPLLQGGLRGRQGT
jgi:hypothetical protein